MAKKILVVDDERSICKLLKQVLEEKGYEIEFAHTGAEALEKLRKSTPDMVILDVMLPDTTGWQILKTMKTSETTKKIPALMLTQKNLVSDVEFAVDLGASGYLVKPFDIERLLKKVGEIAGE
jgi:DNA-binding response OmpR family regulator